MVVVEDLLVHDGLFISQTLRGHEEARFSVDFRQYVLIEMCRYERHFISNHVLFMEGMETSR